MDKRTATELATHDLDYFVRKIKGNYVVWDRVSDHAVTFDGGLVIAVENWTKKYR